MCLTISGRRLTATGPVTSQPVNASYCAFHWFPLVDVALDDIASVPALALTRPGPRGQVEIVGRAPAVRADRARTPPNLLVHFGTPDSAGALDRVVAALRKAVRADVPLAMLAILDAAELSRARHVDGVIYAEADPRWRRLWSIDVAKLPHTAIVDASGKVVWQHTGELDAAPVTDVVRKVLRPTRFAGASIIMPRVRIGHAPPNFVFTIADGRELTLRKLIGNPVTLEFMERSITLRSRHGVVDLPDHGRAIARAYGVAAWPTTIAIDATGVVRQVVHGALHLGAA
jgi:hypothetical protein